MEMGYRLTVDPGDRDLAVVSAALADELPAVVPHVYDATDPEISVEDGLVVWTTPYDASTYTCDLEDHVPDLDVRGAWLAMVYAQEAEYMGDAWLYTWVDGGWALVEERHGEYGLLGADAATYLRREWGVDCESPAPFV